MTKISKKAGNYFMIFLYVNFVRFLQHAHFYEKILIGSYHNDSITHTRHISYPLLVTVYINATTELVTAPQTEFPPPMSTSLK